MFIFNMKINGSKIFKLFFSIIVIILICIMSFVIFRIFKGANNNSFEVKDEIPNDCLVIQPSNYTNILKSVHGNIDNYIGINIKFSGYVYRVLDLNDNQFVLARDMIISSNYQAVVVGFLCSLDGAEQYKDGTWVEVTGEITKGNYHGDMPILKIIDITTIDTPNEEFVYPPDDSYIPTFSTGTVLDSKFFHFQNA